MLDERTQKLLDLINAECQDSGYKVFSLDELALAMPKRLGVSLDGVRESLIVLFSHEYISIKYEDEKEVCLKPLTKGRLVSENKVQSEIARAKAECRYFMSAFLGGALGGIITAMVIMVLFLVFGGKL